MLKETYMEKVPFSGSFGETLIPPTGLGVNAVYQTYNLEFKRQGCAVRTYLTLPGTTISVEKPGVSMSTQGARTGEVRCTIMPAIRPESTPGLLAAPQ
jgi:hypothetical protein